MNETEKSLVPIGKDQINLFFEKNELLDGDICVQSMKKLFDSILLYALTQKSLRYILIVELFKPYLEENSALIKRLFLLLINTLIDHGLQDWDEDTIDDLFLAIPDLFKGDKDFIEAFIKIVNFVDNIYLNGNFNGINKKLLRRSLGSLIRLGYRGDVTFWAKFAEGFENEFIQTIFRALIEIDVKFAFEWINKLDVSTEIKQNVCNRLTPYLKTKYPSELLLRLLDPILLAWEEDLRKKFIELFFR